MKYLLTIVLAVAVGWSAYSQNDSGIFLSIQCAKKSEKHMVALTGKQVCITPSPMILSSEFTSISDLEEHGDKIWFDLTISQKALQTLLRISSSLPNSTFAFVVDKDVFSTFAANDLLVGRTFRFQSTSKHKLIFAETQKKIKSLVAQQTQ